MIYPFIFDIPLTLSIFSAKKLADENKKLEDEVAALEDVLAIASSGNPKTTGYKVSGTQAAGR